MPFFPAGSTRRLSSLSATLLFFLLFIIPGYALAQNGTSGARVIVLGFDGADPKLVERWMDSGDLPNLARLRDEGSYTPLGTTTPPQTPVSWTSFATGINPGRHGIFDFLSRNLKTYQPGFAMFDVHDVPIGLGRNNKWAGGFLLAVLGGSLALVIFRRARWRLPVALALFLGFFVAGSQAVARFIPSQRPEVTRKTEGKTFWEVAGEAGRKSRIIRVPAMFPPDPVEHGEIQSGLGVPDIRGTNGTYLFFTTEPRIGGGANTEKGGIVIPVAFLNGEADPAIPGPPDKLFGGRDLETPLHIVLNKKSEPRSATLTTCGQTLTLPEGEWSDWVHLSFRFNSLIRVQGMARFYLTSVEPFALYMSPINLNPEKSPVPISSPASFAVDLAHRFGLYKTLGWENDTFALDEDVLDEKAFLEDVHFTVDTWMPMMDQLMSEDDLDLYVHVYDFTDRVGHMFWRTLDPDHPAADSTADAPYKDVVLDTYRRMDDIVGRVRSRMNENALLLVCSDHGFNTWRKSVNYNTWLVRNGFMTLTGDTTSNRQMTLDDLFGQGEFWPNVDWSRTRAYALGLGDLYINLKGREAQGSVDPVDYEDIRTDLVERLEAFVDTTNGERPIRRVYRREEVYSGYNPDLIPDLLIANNAGYRVSWQTSLGGIPPLLFETNDKKWSGDHCSLDPEITKGIFFSNRRFDVEGATILDLFPTILEALDVPLPGDLDGKPLVSRR